MFSSSFFFFYNHTVFLFARLAAYSQGSLRSRGLAAYYIETLSSSRLSGVILAENEMWFLPAAFLPEVKTHGRLVSETKKHGHHFKRTSEEKEAALKKTKPNSCQSA